MLSINGIPIKIKVARDDKSRAHGLMGVKSMPENEGMLFVFSESKPRSFWMKDTLFPLSIAYIDEDHKIINIEDMKPHDTSSVVSASPAICALEMNRGWFRNNGIRPGDAVDGIKRVYSESILRKSIRLLLRESSTPTRTSFDIPIPADLKDIHSRIKYAGRELFLVGGAVRDALMGKTPKDYDVATNASPEAVIKILQKDPSLRLDLTGKQFGVVRVKTSDGGEYEIATFREDIGKGKSTKVKFSTIENDVKRRDLTINALFYDMDSKEIVDYVGGIEDIENGIIRAVGNPTQRFDEDRIRILRAVRFAGRMGSNLDPQTKQAILDDNKLIDTETGQQIPADRITEEFVKGIKSAQDPVGFLATINDLGLFDQILPGLELNFSTSGTTDHIAQLAALLNNNSTDSISSTLKRMRYSNDERNIINFLISFGNINRDTAPALKKDFKRYKIPESHLIEYAAASDSLSQNKLDSFLQFASEPPAGNSKELMAKGIKGRDLGVALAAAEGDAFAKLIGESVIVRLLTEAAKGPQDLPDGIFVQIKPDDWGVRVAYVNKLNNVLSMEADIRGVVMVERLSEDDTDLGPCDDAWMIGSSEAAPGWGPMLYDVAMEYATMKGGGLMADRGSVSPKARNVWDYYMNNRGDVTGIQMDDRKNTLTPEEEDNCSQKVAGLDNRSQQDKSKLSPAGTYKTDWVDSPLSKRWTKPPTTIEALRAAGKLVWHEAGDHLPLRDLDAEGPILHLENFVKEILKEETFRILIPSPPSEKERLKELPYVVQKNQNPSFSPEILKTLDKRVSKLFNFLIVSAGYPDVFERIKETKNSIKPIIKFHKNYFDCLRPDELADSYGLDFPVSYLDSAQSPSYPSGHTTQAFYLAHVLASEYPEISEDFYNLAQMVADSRIEHGVHLPSDNEAGKLLAKTIYGWEV